MSPSAPWQAAYCALELDEVVGYFVNTLVLRTDLSGDPTWHELLGRVREVARQAYAHQELPFEKLVAELSPERDLSRNPLFQVLFALHEEPGAGPVTELYDRKELEGRLGTARFDLALDVTDHAAGAGDLSVSVEYATDLFDADFVRGFGRRLPSGDRADGVRRHGPAVRAGDRLGR